MSAAPPHYTGEGRLRVVPPGLSGEDLRLEARRAKMLANARRGAAQKLKAAPSWRLTNSRSPAERDRYRRAAEKRRPMLNGG